MATTEYNKMYNALHKEERAAKRKDKKENDKHYCAGKLARRYKQSDLYYNRGEATIDASWIEENIYTKKCAYCGEEDWHKLGCDRIDNEKPHTPDNVVCCCINCNNQRQKQDFFNFFGFKFINSITE